MASRHLERDSDDIGESVKLVSLDTCKSLGPNNPELDGTKVLCDVAYVSGAELSCSLDTHSRTLHSGTNKFGSTLSNKWKVLINTLLFQHNRQ